VSTLRHPSTLAALTALADLTAIATITALATLAIFIALTASESEQWTKGGDDPLGKKHPAHECCARA
jgi:hypothetical protein